MSRKRGRAQAKRNRPHKTPPGGSKQAGRDDRDAGLRLAWARELLASGKFIPAYKAYKSLVFEPPGAASLVPEVVQVLLSRKALAEAEAFAESAADQFPGDALVWLHLGHARQKAGRAEPALAAYRKSLELNSGSAHAWAAIAQVCERLHRLDEALSAIDEAIQLLPQSYYLAHCRGVILRRLGRLDEAGEVQSAVLESAPEGDAATQFVAWQEAAAIHRANGDPNQSCQALIRAKAAQAPLRAPYLKAYEGFQRGIAMRFDGIDERIVKYWCSGEDVAGTHRQAFIIGHPRSGTTLTQQILAAHPDVLTLDEREALPHIEATVLDDAPSVEALDRLSPEQRNRFLRLYQKEAERYLGQPVEDRLLIDKRPDTLLMLPTVLRIMPRCKLVVVLRDPRDVVASCYRQAFELGVISAQFHSIESTCRYYAWFMAYWHLLRRILPPEMWLEVQYESLVIQTETVTREMIAFLNLDWDDALLSFQDQAARRLVSTPSYSEVARPAHRGAIGGWREHEDAFMACADLLKPHLVGPAR